jgi:hypothetical protein
MTWFIIFMIINLADLAAFILLDRDDVQKWHDWLPYGSLVRFTVLVIHYW